MSSLICSISDRTGALRSVEVFDVSNDMWEASTNLSIARKHPSVAVLGGQIYCVGGMGVDGHQLSTVERFDTIKNRWSFVASLNNCRGE